NDKCYSIVTKAPSSSITGQGNFLDWYFPCNIHPQTGSGGANLTGYENPTNCHVSPQTKHMLSGMKRLGQVYYTWEDVKNTRRNLAVYESYVPSFILSPGF